MVEAGVFEHPCEGEAVCKLTNTMIPYFNAPIFLENKTQVGKVEEVFGPINSVYFTIKMSEGVPIARPAKRRQIESAIGWASGSIDLVLDGDEPVEQDRPSPAGPDVLSRLDELERETAALRQAVARLQVAAERLTDAEQRPGSSPASDEGAEAGR